MSSVFIKPESMKSGLAVSESQTLNRMDCVSAPLKSSGPHIPIMNVPLQTADVPEFSLLPVTVSRTWPEPLSVKISN